MISESEASEARCYNAVDSLLVDEYLHPHKVFDLSVSVATELSAQASSITSWRLGSVADNGLQNTFIDLGLLAARQTLRNRAM